MSNSYNDLNRLKNYLRTRALKLENETYPLRLTDSLSELYLRNLLRELKKERFRIRVRANLRHDTVIETSDKFEYTIRDGKRLVEKG